MFVAKVQLEGYSSAATIKWCDGKLSGEGTPMIRDRLEVTEPVYIVCMGRYEGRAIIDEGCVFVQWLHRESGGRIELLEGQFPEIPQAPEGGVN